MSLQTELLSISYFCVPKAFSLCRRETKRREEKATPHTSKLADKQLEANLLNCRSHK